MSSHLPLVQIPPWGTMMYDDWRSTDISVYLPALSPDPSMGHYDV